MARPGYVHCRPAGDEPTEFESAQAEESGVTPSPPATSDGAMQNGPTPHGSTPHGSTLTARGESQVWTLLESDAMWLFMVVVVIAAAVSLFT